MIGELFTPGDYDPRRAAEDITPDQAAAHALRLYCTSLIQGDGQSWRRYLDYCATRGISADAVMYHAEGVIAAIIPTK